MKKTLNVIKNILVWAMVVLAVGMMIFTVISVNTFDRADRSVFGYKMFIVLSDSMSKTDFSAGDLIFSKEVDPATLKEGDIISYQSTNSENYGEVVTHKIRRVTVDSEGNMGFVTYGTTTDADDANVVTFPYVLGKYTAKLPGAGTFFQFLKTTPGYIVCIFLPFLLLIIIQGVNSIRLFRRYKNEQMAEMEQQREAERKAMEAEREKLAEERKRQEDMMAELLKMKEELSKNKED